MYCANVYKTVTDMMIEDKMIIDFVVKGCYTRKIGQNIWSFMTFKTECPSFFRWSYKVVCYESVKLTPEKNVKMCLSVPQTP